MSEIDQSWKRAVEEEMWLDPAHGRLMKGLEKLEQAYGFNPKIASEVYSKSLLNPEQGKLILSRWAAFLQDINDHSGEGMILLEDCGRKVQAAYVRSITLEDIAYNDGTSSRYRGQASITLDSPGIKTIRTWNGQLRYGPIRLGMSSDGDYAAHFNFDSESMKTAFTTSYDEFLEFVLSESYDGYQPLRSLAEEAYPRASAESIKD